VSRFDSSSADPRALRASAGTAANASPARFARRGCHVVETSSPLEAISEIGESRLYLRAIVIGDTEPAPHAAELRRFFGETYPGVPVIDVGRTRTRGTPRITVDGAPALELPNENLVGMHEHLGGLV
jgi:hypothetical protein